MCHALLGDARLFEQLLRFDEDLAASARARGCPCGGRLHSARYARKPRGCPAEVDSYNYRLSFCCDRDGCRSRVTPPSLRFLGRRVYVGAVVVLVGAMMRELTPWRVARLCALLGVDRRTLKRWRRWWREAFPSTSMWRDAKARFMPPVREAELPASLLERFDGEQRARLVGMLKLLRPLTTSSRSLMVVSDPQRTLAARCVREK